MVAEAVLHRRTGHASRAQVDILIWERGAGYTLASGSSSSADALISIFNR